MDYLVSARKYRPQSFSAVVGQNAIAATLQNAVRSGKLAHAFLFCGPRGVGKTTCARIFAKTINCESMTPDGEACGKCESCLAFAEQRSYNVFELDAASNNSVENIKQLMEQTRIPPQTGRYKVFIIDEAHMLSTQAFNAFLKTLEEPPSYVIFILATTEKNKLLPTILSRCQIYDFERMTSAGIVEHLKMVAERENCKYETEALEVIAEKADGGMRDALSIFDQAASFCQGNITLEKVMKDLNLTDVDNYFRLTDMALQNKCADIMLLLNEMIESGIDAGRIISGLAEHLRNVMMAKDPQTIALLEASERHAQRYAEQAERCTAPFIYKALQILTRCDINYKQSSSKRLLAEITLIEVAQITQPGDKDGVPRKGRRLKTLFEKLAPIQPKQVLQVTAAVEKKTRDAHAPAAKDASDAKAAKDASASTLTNAATATAPIAGVAGVNGNIFGSTFSALGGAAKKQQEEKADDEAAGKQSRSPFTYEQLSFEWLAMCNRMESNPEMRGLAHSLRNCQLEMADFPNVMISVNNNILLEQIKSIQGRITATLAQRLKNDEISFAARVAESSEVKNTPSKYEMLENMKTAMPALGFLVRELELEIV